MIFGQAIPILVVALLGYASPAEPDAFKTCNIPYTVVDFADHPEYYQILERQYPRGTREYRTAPAVRYLLGTRASTVTYEGDTSFSCDGSDLRVTVGDEPKDSRVIPVKDIVSVTANVQSEQYFVTPGGHGLPRFLQQGIEIGHIHYYRTL